LILTPKNWNSFQHYKDRAPAWIKLHKALLDDYEFACLPLASKALAPMLWLLASEYENGQIDASLDKLAFRLHMTRGDLADALSHLIERGFFDASEPLAERKQEASLEKEREEEVEKRERREDTREDALLSDFEAFWKIWPNKVGKPAALKAFRSAVKRAEPGVICDGVIAYERNKPPDRPWLNPATFLNQNRWEDRPAQVAHGRIQEAESLSHVARRFATEGISFGAKPEAPSLRSIEGGDHVRLLPQGRSERPGDIRSGDIGGSERVFAGGDRLHHRPEDRPAEQIEVVAERVRGPGGV
jgi:hypothetical protein